MHVSDIMHTGDALPTVQSDASLHQALHIMSEKGLGMTAVLAQDGRLLGIFTDGDLRRTLDKPIDIHTVRVSQVMTANCKTAPPGMLAAEALQMMDQMKINGLLVVDKDDRLVGAFNMHDLLRSGVM